MYDRKRVYFKSSEKQLFNSCLDAVKNLGYSAKVLPGNLLEINVGGLFSKKKMIIDIDKIENENTYVLPQYIDTDESVYLDNAFEKIINKMRQTTG
ncbi:hypothetical protein [Shewanella putrefaciens]|uniref:hypothetical protein n=1 Tax=Shewanella putrefaciens TaxID=24 RepID=UPI00242FB0BB|nr:hypothetical protein [Shewanella putrefaciens]MCA1898647.1 hypothetical protein [Shewanella putrefaciens]